MKHLTSEEKLEKEFHVSWYIIFYKLILGLIESITGFGILFLGKQILARYLLQVTQELSEDPHDFIARISMGIVPQILVHNTSLVFTLILLGIAKIAGAVGLIYKQNWGVDLLVGITILMFPFQLINLLLHRSFFDLVYITVGILIAMYLIEFKPKAWISRIFRTTK
jgi:uncharacterized membrane protein